MNCKNRARFQVFLGLMLLSAVSVFGQDNYAFDKIPPALLEGANAVVRIGESSWEIVSRGEAKRREKLVVTILNESGEDDYDQLYVFYDKFTKVSDIEGILYDSNGKVLKKLRNANIEDYGYGGAGNDILDGRVKVASFGKKAYSYPYTIEYTYEIKERNMMFYPKWRPTSNSKTALESSSYMIKAPSGFNFRYKEYNGAPVVVKNKDVNGADVYLWKLENKPATKVDESYSLPALESLPMVLAGPSEFEVLEHKGNFSTWNDMGKFYYALNDGRGVLPEAVQNEIKNIVKGATSEREKIDKVYKWMQGRSRYVSIQLGIGGWQTIDAATVAAKGYGDCKALTNFTIAALNYAGIKSYAALIRAGDDEKIKTDFSVGQFNHAIACAFAGKDTVWLECTSQTTPPNYLGDFTNGRPALLITPEGGKLVTTPDYSPEDNLRARNLKVKLEANGDGEVLINTVYKGIRQDAKRSLIHRGNADGQRKTLIEELNLTGMEIRSFDFAEKQQPEVLVNEKINMFVRNCATKSGTRLFVKANLLPTTFILPTETQRSTPFYLPTADYNMTNSDTVTYQIPEGYKLESSLPAEKVETAFGTFELLATVTGNTLVCVRKLKLKGGTYPATDYAAWLTFIKKIRRVDRSQVVFVGNS